jgi:hypothetical protein
MFWAESQSARTVQGATPRPQSEPTAAAPTSGQRKKPSRRQLTQFGFPDLKNPSPIVAGKPTIVRPGQRMTASIALTASSTAKQSSPLPEKFVTLYVADRQGPVNNPKIWWLPLDDSRTRLVQTGNGEQARAFFEFYVPPNLKEGVYRLMVEFNGDAKYVKSRYASPGFCLHVRVVKPKRRSDVEVRSKSRPSASGDTVEGGNE